MSRQTFMDAIVRRRTSPAPVFGTGTSIASRDLMNRANAHFPQAHLNPEKMAQLALTGHTILDFDVVMPLFSVCHEAAAMGCNVNWGTPEIMPEAGKPILKTPKDIRIPGNLLQKPGCAVPIEAIRLLKKWLGDDAAVCGKVFGSWTQAYHYFGVEEFLMMSVDSSDAVHEILEKLMPVTLAFARAQIDAGADCLLLADHATRDLCSPGAYEEFLLGMHSRLAEEIGVPLILHICGNTADRIGMISRTGLACFHWDTKTGSPGEVRKLVGGEMGLMGGVSNYLLLRGTPDEVRAAVAVSLASDIDVIGPECAIPLGTPLANLKAVAGCC